MCAVTRFRFYLVNSFGFEITDKKPQARRHELLVFVVCALARELASILASPAFLNRI